MNGEQDDHLKQRHAYESWRGRNTLNENLFIWNLFLGGNEFPGFQAHRIQRIASEETGQHLIRSIWQQSTRDSERLLGIDTVECPSRTAAHELLLQMLGEFQGAVVTRKEQLALGDVTFTAPGESMVLFARANLVVMVRNAGRDLVPVTSVARELDAVLSSNQEAAARRIELKTEEYVLGQRIPLSRASDRSLDSQWYKFFSSPGEVLLEEGTLVYDYSSEERPEITVLAINPRRDAASQNMVFEGSVMA